MVSLTEVSIANAKIATLLPPGLVAVFVGGTSGIGEFTLKALAKRAVRPRIYIVGRSEEAAERIKKECAALNPRGEYLFIPKDVSLIGNVDELCREIASREKFINILVVSAGTLVMGVETKEGLDLATALLYYQRVRVVANLLPLLVRAPSFRRVMFVGAGTKEGPVDTSDFSARKVPLTRQRGHVVSMTTLALEELARRAPGVSFINDFPGAVKTGIGRGARSPAMLLMRAVFAVVGPLVYVPAEECGERHLYALTSARYPAGDGAADEVGVPVGEGLGVAVGTDGKVGSGVYTIDREGESGGPKVVELLAQLRKEGVGKKVWEHTEGEFKRISGVAAIEL